MALTKDVYRAFEDIVGPEYISSDAGILDSYSYHFSAECIVNSHWMQRPEAVLLPENTKQVQAVVKASNRYGVKFKAMSTGWGPWNAPLTEGVIQLDLRRLNRILDIDEKNMLAVVEPYVISAQLQAELMKRGLSCNIIGAGSNTTALSVTKHCGVGHLGITHSCEQRNVLAVEWVLPTGEILNLGSLGQGAGWFCADGPGPSLRGMARGHLGAMGGIGVFTKGATKVYHWPGQPAEPIKWSYPSYAPDIPEFAKLWILMFPTWKRLADFAYKVSASEAAYIVVRLGPMDIPAFLSASNEEMMEMGEQIAPTLPDKLAGFLVIVAAETKAEFDYKVKVVKQIIGETEGKTLKIAEDPEMQKKLFWIGVRSGVQSRGVFRPTGTFTSTYGSLDTIDLAVAQGRAATALKMMFIEKGEILDDGADHAWGMPYEMGHLMHLETPVMGHPTSDGARGMKHYARAADEAFLVSNEGDAKGKMFLDKDEYPVCGGTPLGALLDNQHDRFGPVTSNYHVWMRKLKKAFDPNNAADSSFYIKPKE